MTCEKIELIKLSTYFIINNKLTLMSNKLNEMNENMQKQHEEIQKYSYFLRLNIKRLVLAEFNLALRLYEKTDNVNLREMFENDLKYLKSNENTEKMYPYNQCYLRNGINDIYFVSKLSTFLKHLSNDLAPYYCKELVKFKEHKGVSLFITLQKLLETELQRLVQIENDTNDAKTDALNNTKLPDDLKQYINAFVKKPLSKHMKIAQCCLNIVLRRDCDNYYDSSDDEN